VGGGGQRERKREREREVDENGKKGTNKSEIEKER